MSHPIALPTAAEVSVPAGHTWSKVPLVSFAAAAVGLVGGYFTAADADAFAYSYFVAFMYVLSLGLGSLFFVLIQHAAHAGWSVVVRRIAENLAFPLTIMSVLFIPVWLARETLWHHWMHAGATDHDPILAAKAGYLNEGFWNIRALIFFAVWALLALWFRHTSIKQDSSDSPEASIKIGKRLIRWSFLAIVAFALSTSFAAFDWGMSLDPHWFSTMWGVYFFAGSIMSGFALLGLTVLLLQGSGLLRDQITTEHHHDLGKLVMAFTIFWTYIAFSQYFLIWYGNIPEETSWFAHRMGNSWESLGIALMFGHFAIPFLFMMPRTIKRKPATLLVACVWMLVFHYLDLYYALMPANPAMHGGADGSISDILTVVGLTGVFYGLATFMMQRAALIPVKDPRLAESLSFTNF